MINILSKLFIKNRHDLANAAVRKAYGTMCCVLGIVLNVLLFAGKFAAGILTGSIAITADAYNNLSDAGSSVISLLGFRLADMKPDPEHPAGHGRIEYVSGLGVAALILLMGLSLAKDSAEKILSPQPMESGVLAVIVLLISIAVKAYMYFYNRSMGKRLSSSAMLATSMDCLSDCLATAVVLAATLIYRHFGYNVDGYAGIVVSIAIVVAGIKAAKDTITPLLGQAPDREFVKSIEDLVLQNDVIVGVHDIIVHDYGPGRRMISLHAEVVPDKTIFEIHEQIDKIEALLKESLGCDAVIHMDPVDISDKTVSELRQKVERIAAEKYPGVSIHDFRVTSEQEHTNLIFDLVVPFDLEASDDEVKDDLLRSIEESLPGHKAVITVDKPYV